MFVFQILEWAEVHKYDDHFADMDKQENRYAGQNLIIVVDECDRKRFKVSI